MSTDAVERSLGFPETFSVTEIPTDPQTGEWGIEVREKDGKFSCKIRCAREINRDVFSREARLLVTAAYRRGKERPSAPSSLDAQQLPYRFVHQLPEELFRLTGMRFAIKGLPKGQDKREDFEEQFRFMNALKRGWEENATKEQQDIVGVCAPCLHVSFKEGSVEDEFLLLPEIDASRYVRDKHLRAYLRESQFGKHLHPKLVSIAGSNTFSALASSITRISGIGPLFDLFGRNTIIDRTGKYWLIDLHARSQTHRRGF